MARKKAGKYLDNGELLDRLKEVFEVYFPHLNPSDFAVDDTVDEATAKVSFVFSRPTTADVEKARKAQEQYRKNLEEMFADWEKEAAGEVLEGESREIPTALAKV